MSKFYKPQETINTGWKYGLFSAIRLFIVEETLQGFLQMKLVNKRLPNLKLLVAAALIFFCNAVKSQVILSQDFESAWTTASTLSPAWSSVGTANNQWQKQSFSTGWTSNSGLYSPTGVGSCGSWGSARFHSFDAVSGTTGDLITSTMDFSAAGTKTLTFWMINTSGTDKIEVALSIDNGGTYGAVLSTSTIFANWTLVTVSLGSSTAVQCKVRFRATSDFGTTDIGIDRVTVFNGSNTMSGTYTIDNSIAASTTNYTCFTTAIADLNERGIGASVIFNVKAGQTFTEDAPIITATGTVSNTITFQRSGAGANPVIKPTGGAGANDAGISISGGDYFTFDGIDVNIASGSALEYGYYLTNPTSTNGAQNNVIKNTKIILNRTNTSSIGIFQAYTTAATSAAGANSTNKYYNFTIENSYNGIYLLGTSAFPDLNSEIGITSGGTTTVGAATAADIGNGSTTIYGIRVAQQQDVKIFNCEVRNVTGTSTNTVHGIYLETAKGSNTQIYNNKVHDINSTSTGTTPMVIGIRVDVASGLTAYVYNNFVYGLTQSPSSANSIQTVRGIAAHYAATTGTINFYYNSVRIETLSSNATSTAFYMQSGTVNLKDNIFTNFTVGAATSKRYAAYISSGTLSTSDYNDLYVATGTNNFTGYNTTDQATLGNWQTSTSKDAASIGADPQFISSTNLHINTTSTVVDGKGNAIAGYASDIDADVRCTSACSGTSIPDIGADEFTSTVACATAPSGLAAGSINTTAASISFTCTSCTGTFVLEYGAVGFSPGTGASAGGGTVVTSASSPIALSGLTANTTYDVYIRNNCSGSNYSSNSVKISFTTLCAALNVPYTQNFDAVTVPAIPTCMSVENTNADAYFWQTCTSTSLGNATAITPNSGANQMGIRYNGSAAMDDWFFLPAINLTGSTSYRLSFYVRGYTGLTEQIEVKYGTTATSAGMTTGTILASTAIPGNIAYSQKVIDFAPGSTGIYYIGFHGLSASNQWYLFVDDVSLTLTPATLSGSALTGFGNVCTNTTAGPNSFTITGTALTAANVTVGALTGFTYSTTSAGTYTASLSLTQPGGAYSQQIFVKFTPTLVQSYNGNIPVGGGGASSINVAATGSGVNTLPAVSSGVASGITSTGGTVAGTISVTGCTAITAYGIEYSTTNGFANGAGTAVSSSNLSGGNFSSALSPLTPNTTYYFHTYATNSGGTAYGTQGSFTTTCINATLPYPQGFNSTTFPACWSQQYVTGTSDMQFVPNCTNPTILTPQDGADFVYWNSFSITSGNQTRLVSAPITTTGSAIVNARFYWYHDNSAYTTAGYADEGVVLQYSLDGVSWTSVQTINRLLTGVDGWTLYDIALPAGAGNAATMYVGFLFTSRLGDNCALDNLLVYAPAPCTTPTNQPAALALTSVTSTSLSASFTAASPAPSGYIVLRSTSSTAPVLINGTLYNVGSAYALPGNSYTVISSNSSTSFTQTGLTPNTRYYYYAFSFNSSCSGQPYYLNTSPATANALTCTAAPATLTATTINSSSATINFSAVTGAASYILQYSIAGANSWITASPAPTGSPYTLTGLSPGTAYDIRLEGPNSNCGTVTTSTNAFTTTCATITSLPWSEKFDGMASIGSGIVPPCWTHVAGTKSFYSSNASYTTYHDPYSGVNYMTIAYSNTAASIIWTPGIQLTAGVSYDFSFKWVGDGFSGWTGDALYNTSVSTTGAINLGSFVASATTTTTAYTTKTYTFTAPSTAVYYFATRVSSNATPWYLGFDDYSLKVTPPCNTPGTTSASSNTICGGSGSVTLYATDYSVSGAGLAYNWQISTDNVTFTDIAGATNPATYNTGTISASRYYRLRVFCTSLGNSYSTVQTISVGSYSITGTTGATRCGVGTVTLNATATPGATISWYDIASGGTSIGNGSSFTTPEISATTNYYVGANNGVAAVTIGATYSGSGTNGTNVGSHGIVINTTSPNIIIISAKIPFSGKGTFTIELQTTAGVTVTSVTTPEITGNASVPVTVPLNIAVTTPGTYRLLITAITGTIDELGYISSATYPYTGLGGAFSVTSGYWYGNDASSNMYLFNLVVSNICESVRTLVTATVTAAPALTISPTSATICSGNSTSINVTTPASNFATYSWSPSTGLSVSGSPPGTTVTLNPTTTINYTLTATSASNCVNKVTALITVNAAPPTTTGAAVCSGTNATISATSSCTNYGNPTLTINGNYDAAIDATAPRPIIYIANSPTCNFDPAVIRNYTVQDFQVTVTGTYTFVMPNTTAFDGMGYIVTGAFVPGTCPGTGVWIVGDDDSGPTTFEPFMSATLTAGVTYTLITTTYAASSGTYTGPYTWNITGPVGGAITTVSGGTLQWYTIPSGGTSISSASPFNPVGVAGSGIATNTSVGSYTFYAACSNNSTCRTATGYVIGTTGQWIGAANSTWSNVANWCGAVPTISTDASISLGAPNMPVLSTGTGPVRNVTVNTGAILTIDNATMQIAGTITAAPNTITATNGTIELAGNTAQSISGSSFTGRTLQNLIASNSINVSSVLNDTLRLSGTLSFGNVNGKVFNSNDNVTLVSTAAGTARVADITNNGVNNSNTFSGKFIVERYIPARRAWRLLTAPVVAGSQTINQCWQEGVGGNWALDPNPGYGTHITGGPARTTLQGFDQGPLNASIYGHSGTAWSYLPATTGEMVTNRQGWMLFVRGSRAINLPLSNTGTAADITVLRPAGAIKFGTQPTITNAAGGFTVVGNPYPSPVNFNAFTRSGVIGGIGGNNAYYLWDPYLGGGSGVGAFVTFSRNGTVYDKTIVTGTGSSNITNTGVIPSGAALMVNLSAGGSIGIAESSKTVDVPGPSYLFRPATTPSSLRTTLYVLNTDEPGYIADGNLITFSESSNTAVDMEDAVKVNNFSENFSVIRDGVKIAIERRNAIAAKDTIFYSMWNMKRKNYQFELALHSLNLPAGTLPFLEDTYLNQKTALQVDDTTRVNFSVTAEAASAAAGRFRIVFDPSSVVPVMFTELRAYQQGNDIAVEWTVQNEFNIVGYDVEKSLDGIHFTYMNNTTATGGNAGYNWLDEHAVTGDNFYRIKSKDNAGRVQYSRIVKVSIGKGKPSISIYPNPVTDDVVNLAFSNMPGGLYNVKICNVAGQVVIVKQVTHASGSSSESVKFNNKLSKGTYQLEVIKKDGDKETFKLVVE